MIEQFMSRDDWDKIVESMKDETRIPEEKLKSWAADPVSTDYIEGAIVGILTLSSQLLIQEEIGKENIAGLSQSVVRNLLLVLYRRGFDPFKNIPREAGRPSQTEIDTAVERLLRLNQDPPKHT